MNKNNKYSGIGDNLQLLDQNNTLFYDKSSSKLYEVNIHNLSTSNSGILASIYIEGFENSLLKDTLLKAKIKHTSKLKIDDYDYILRNTFKMSQVEIDKFNKILIKYSQIQRLMIGELLNIEDRMKFLECFHIDRSGSMPKYNLNQLNNLTIYFILKDKKVKLLNKVNNNDKSRKYIVKHISVLQNDLKKTSLKFLLGNKKHKNNNIEKLAQKQINLL